MKFLENGSRPQPPTSHRGWGTGCTKHAWSADILQPCSTALQHAATHWRIVTHNTLQGKQKFTLRDERHVAVGEEGEWTVRWGGRHISFLFLPHIATHSLDNIWLLFDFCCNTFSCYSFILLQHILFLLFYFVAAHSFTSYIPWLLNRCYRGVVC